MKKIGQILLGMSIVSGALVAEPSVYGNASGQYTSPQKSVASNKKSIALLKQKVAQQKERIDGLQSIVEGLSQTVHDMQEDLQNTNLSQGAQSDTALLKELGEMIDKINGDYVSKAELQKALSAKGNYVPTDTPAKSATKQQKTDESLASKSTKELYSEGVRLFVKKRYDEAKKRFVITDAKGHKPAASNYYMGEIAYYTKKYEDAIFYFKKSAGLYDQASYIDTLLLHTAISLEKSGEKAQAKAFYENIIANYKGKKSADIAKEKLKKL